MTATLPEAPAEAPSSLERWRPTGAQTATGAVLLAAFLLVNHLPLWHTDVWAHLKFGRWIVTNGRLPDHEPFCPTADQAAVYVNFQWLSQTLLYVAYHAGELLSGGDDLARTAGGVEALRTLHALLVALRCGLLLWALRRAGAGPGGAAAGVALMLGLSVANVGVLRPQVFGELAFAALLVLAGAPVLPRVGVAVTLVLWANLHGSYPVGLALLTGLLAGNLLDRRWAAARRVAGALALAVVAVALLNPHGPALFAHTWALAGHPNVQDFDEWKPVQWATPWGALFAGSLLLLTGTALVRAIRSRRWRLTGPQLVLMLGFGAQTYLHVRMVPWWVMLVPWFLLPRSDEPPGLPRRFGRTAAMKPAARLVAAGIVLVAFALSGVGHWWREGAPRPLAQAVHSGTPWELAEGLKAEAARGHWHGRVFASETQGDYLLWALPPEVPVTLYTHVHLFPRPTWLDALTVKRGEPGWAAVLDRLEVRLIVCEADLHPGLRQALLGAKDAWRIVRDEAGDPAKKDPKGRVLVAVRR